jgi:DNA-binding XRE family transcriptional regulator
MPPRTRIEPNREDPLSETTPGRRLWAASLAAGYETRTSFARAIGIQHNTLSLVESDRTLLSLENFAMACQLVGYSMEEIFFGRAPRRREPHLSAEGIVVLCEELGAEAAERHAFKRFLDSPEGALQRLTRAYVTAFMEAHKSAQESGATPEAALRKAIVAADNARATADALAAGVKPPSRRYRNRPQGRPAQKRR